MKLTIKNLILGAAVVCGLNGCKGVSLHWFTALTRDAAVSIYNSMEATGNRVHFFKERVYNQNGYQIKQYNYITRESFDRVGPPSTWTDTTEVYVDGTLEERTFTLNGQQVTINCIWTDWNLNTFAYAKYTEKDNKGVTKSVKYQSDVYDETDPETLVDLQVVNKYFQDAPEMTQHCYPPAFSVERQALTDSFPH